MSAFLAGILAFPTVILTILLLVIFAYWLFVVLGAIDIDVLSGGDGILEGVDGAADGLFDGAAEGAIDGVAEGAVDGVAEGAVDGVAEGAVDGVAEGAADGVAEGAADGVAEGAADGVAEGAADAATDGVAEATETSPGFLASFMSFFRLRSAPITVSISIWVLTWWAFSYLSMRSTSSLGLPQTVLGLLVFVLTGGASLFLTSFLIRPLAPLFKTHTAASRTSLVAGECTIRTGTVDDEFGQAEYEDGAGASHIIDVRCDPPNTLRRGDKALILDFDEEREAFVVEPLDRLLSLPPESNHEPSEEESTELEESTAEA